MSKYLYGILGAICLGSITSIGKLALIDTSPETILFFRFLIVISLMLGGTLLFNRLRDLYVRKQHIPLMILSGLFFAIETIGFWIALDHIEIIPLLSLFWSFPLINFGIDIIKGDMKFKWNYLFILVIGFIGVMLASGYL